MTENTRVTLLYLGSACGLFILFAIWYISHREKNGQEIKENIGYAIGTLDQYNFAYGPRVSSTSILISFDIKSGRVENVPIAGNYGGFDESNEGSRYLAIYDTLSPETCHILFDYPIKDSTDFNRYIEELKTKPLDFSKYF